MNVPLLATDKLICLFCARTADCPPEDQVRYMQAREWPRCCGQVMAFCPQADDTRTSAGGDQREIQWVTARRPARHV